MKFSRQNSAQKHRLNLKLKPIFVGQLLILESLEYPAFHFDGEKFNLVLESHEGITSEFISDYARNYSSDIFIYREDYQGLNLKLKDELTKLTRSLSIGDVKKNGIKQANFLSMQMDALYKDPLNDELLSNQFQNSKNFSQLLLNNKDIHKPIFKNINQGRYHYTYKQPLLSSVLLLGFLQSLKLFTEKEIEGFFLTSYFKDIGMSFIPREKFELAHLNNFDKKLFASHSKNSMEILKGRVPLSTAQLNLIKNHHYLNYKIQAIASGNEVFQDSEFLTGVESALLSAIDILIAMTSDRPYRKGLSSFQALELLKKVISDDYPQEFKALVFYLKNFMSK